MSSEKGPTGMGEPDFKFPSKPEEIQPHKSSEEIEQPKNTDRAIEIGEHIAGVLRLSDSGLNAIRKEKSLATLNAHKTAVQSGDVSALRATHPGLKTDWTVQDSENVLKGYEGKLIEIQNQSSTPFSGGTLDQRRLALDQYKDNADVSSLDQSMRELEQLIKNLQTIVDQEPSAERLREGYRGWSDEDINTYLDLVYEAVEGLEDRADYM